MKRFFISIISIILFSFSGLSQKNLAIECGAECGIVITGQKPNSIEYFDGYSYLDESGNITLYNSTGSQSFQWTNLRISNYAEIVELLAGCTSCSGGVSVGEPVANQVNVCDTCSVSLLEELIDSVSAMDIAFTDSFKVEGIDNILLCLDSVKLLNAELIEAINDGIEVTITNDPLEVNVDFTELIDFLDGQFEDFEVTATIDNWEDLFEWLLENELNVSFDELTEWLAGNSLDVNVDFSDLFEWYAENCLNVNVKNIDQVADAIAEAMAEQDLQVTITNGPLEVEVDFTELIDFFSDQFDDFNVTATIENWEDLFEWLNENDLNVDFSDLTDWLDENSLDVNVDFSDLFEWYAENELNVDGIDEILDKLCDIDSTLQVAETDSILEAWCAADSLLAEELLENDSLLLSCLDSLKTLLNDTLQVAITEPIEVIFPDSTGSHITVSGNTQDTILHSLMDSLLGDIDYDTELVFYCGEDGTAVGENNYEDGVFVSTTIPEGANLGICEIIDTIDYEKYSTFICVNGKTIERIRCYENDVLVGTLYEPAIESPLEFELGACEIIDTSAYDHIFCSKWSKDVVFIDNTFTRFNRSYDYTFELEDGTTKKITFGPFSNPNGWSNQVDGITAAIQAAFPNAIAESRCNFTGGCGGLLPPPSDAEPSSAIFARYTSVVFCPTDNAIVGGKITSTNGNGMDGKDLVVEIVRTDEKRGWVCKYKDEERVVLLDKDCKPVPPEDQPACWFACAEDIPAKPDALCLFVLSEDVCDNVGTYEDDTDDVEIIKVYSNCDGELSFSYQIEVDGALEDYELVGDEVDCDTGEPIVCEFISKETLCDLSTCSPVDVVTENCGGVPVINYYLVGTDIPTKVKELGECTPKNIIKSECFEVNEYNYTWDNGYAGYPFVGSPSKYNTPWGSVISLNGNPMPNGGFIDKLLTCGTATIDDIVINGSSIIASPVVETTTTGTWIGLNNLLWQTITANTAYTLPKGKGCDVPPVIPSTNCYGKSISCDDIPSDVNGDIGYFDVTDCKGRVWRFSIRKTGPATETYTAITYEDCNGEMQCQYINDFTKQIVEEIDTMCLVVCTPSIELKYHLEICHEGLAYIEEYYSDGTRDSIRVPSKDDCCPIDYKADCKVTIAEDNGNGWVINHPKWTADGYDELIDEAGCPTGQARVLNYDIKVYIDGTEYTGTVGPITIPTTPEAILDQIIAGLNSIDPNSNFSKLGSGSTAKIEWAYDSTVDTGFYIEEFLGPSRCDAGGCGAWSFSSLSAANATPPVDCICAGTDVYPYRQNGVCIFVNTGYSNTVCEGVENK